MANGRNARKKIDTGRDAGRFITLPVSVLESVAYLGLSANARALLMEVALQCHGDDNGRLLLSRAHMVKRGWLSSDMLTKGKRELLDAGLIFETVKGQRPNKASWYAVTWRRLDRLPGFDAGAALTFERGSYNKKPLHKNAVLRPPHGTGGLSIAPPHGVAATPPVPLHGAIRAAFGPVPVPPHGHPLETHGYIPMKQLRPTTTSTSTGRRMAAMLRRARPAAAHDGYAPARDRFHFTH